MQRDIEDYTEKYINHDFEHILVKYRYKKVLEILEQYKPKNILEVGCGEDSIFNYYKDYNNFVIVEPSKIFYESAKHSPNINNRVEIINDFLENQMDVIKNREFDFILLSGLLHEVPDLGSILKPLVSFCNQKTILHANVPNSKSFHLLWAYESGLINNLGSLTPTAISLQQNTVFDLEKLQNIFLDFGFEIIERGSYFIKPFNYSKMKDCINNDAIDERLLDGLYKMVKYFPEFGAEIFVNCRLKND